MDKETYKKTMKRMHWKGERLRCCYICGLDDPSILNETELHHIDGRANSELVIDLCKNCHSKVTSEQQKAAPKDRSANAPLRKRRGMQIISHSRLLRVLADHDLEIGREMMDDDDHST